MRRVVTFILVVVLPILILAGDLVITPVDNGDGTLSINYTQTGDPVVCLSLIVDLSGSSSQVVGVAGGGGNLNVYVDYYHSNPGALNDNNFGDDGGNPAADPDGPGVATLPASVVALSMCELDDVNNTPASGTLAVVDFGGYSCGVIYGDTLRGCAVDVFGNKMTINGQPCDSFKLTFEDIGDCSHEGDIADAAATLGLPDGVVGFGDLNALISALAPTFANIPVGTDPRLDYADIADAAATLGVHDGMIGFGDLNALITALSPTFADRDTCTDPLY